jgi:hypothetical protein
VTVIFFFGRACGAGSETDVSSPFELGENGLRTIDNTQWQSGEAGDLDAVSAIGGAGVRQT